MNATCWRALASGLVGGAVGTLAVMGSELIEVAILGRRPLYAPSLIVQRLLSRRGAEPSAHTAARLGAGLRWAYGPTLGLVFDGLYPGTRSVWRRGLVTGGSVLLFELIAMPLVGATPPVALWPRSDVLLLGLHTLAYGVGSAVVWRSRHRHDRGPHLLESAAAHMLNDKQPRATRAPARWRTSPRRRA